VPGACCHLPSDLNTTASFTSFTTANQPGTCGSFTDVTGMSSNIACSGLFFGGGGNSVPLPSVVPDLGHAVSKITSCAGQTATLAAASSTETGSVQNCTATNCLFGAPLAVPNASSTPTSTCVINHFSADMTGSVDCANGMSDITAPLSSQIFLTGDLLPDTGIQPCPLCVGSTCSGGPNNGMPCTAGTTDLGDSYPTSHDCPPDPMADIGALPIAFSLSSGTVTWTGTPATNDDGVEANLSRVFSGFCRDADTTGNFETPAHKCWENGMAVGAACAGTFETCEQRTNGAFGPGGGGNNTITVIGASSGLLSGPAAGTLVSIFGIPPTFNATVDAAGDLPGPGAVALPGTAALCSSANPCPAP
jgi:hypothetical protein